tara:strand:+ start:788 stop:7642 length:6855 start_codon:yes stop_codon:yes gene_type:complete
MPLSNTTQNALRSEYFDDYYEVANTTTVALRGTEFDFHRILFRPRYGVQSRELVQMQTILQAQLERLGTSQFRDGDRVVGGQLTIDTSAISGQVLPTTTLTNFFIRETNRGKYIYDTSANTVKAHVTQFVSVDDGDTSNNYLIFKYASADTFGASGTVQDRDDASITATFATGANANVFHTSTTISIDEGVCFVAGFFVRVRPQTIVLDAFTNAPSCRVGFTVYEEILDELDDVVGESLLDPANRGAVGAHRFRVRLSLSKRNLDADADPNFIEIARVVDGEVQYTRGNAQFVTNDEMQRVLARRTYDESGDYTIKAFTPVIEGATTANSTNSANTETFVLALGPGKAYVRGFEIETNEPVRKSINKGRTTANANNRTIATTVGSFVYASRVAVASPNTYFANTSSVDIHCVNAASILATSNTTYAHSKIGTAKVRMLETHSVPSEISVNQYANNSVYKLFFYDTSFDTLTGNVTSAAITAGAVILTIPSGNGLPLVNSAILGAGISLDGASSPISGTFTVSGYTANSTASYLTLREYLSILPNGNTTYRLLFQPKDIDCFALRDGTLTLNAPYATNLKFQADVSPDSKDNGSPTGSTYVEATNDSSLLFQIPESFIAANTLAIASAEFSTWYQSASNTRTFAVASNGTLSVVFAGNTFSLPVGSMSAVTAQEYFQIFDITTGDANGHGQIIQFADSSHANSRYISNVSVISTGISYELNFTYHHGANTSVTRTFSALGKALVTGYPARTKTYYVGNTTHALAGTTGALSNGQVEFHTLNAVAGFAYSLKTHDVTSLRKVLYKSSNTAFANGDMSTATDVTDYFRLDDGQRDNTYEYSRLIAKAGATTVVQPTGRLLAIFDWFQHSGLGYATVDSYLSSPNVAKGMTYDDIPSYASPKFRRSIDLRNVLDFRPARSNYEFVNAALIYAATDTTANAQYTDSTGAPYLIPVSDDIWNGSYQYYLSRIDRVALYPDGEFHVIEGQPAVTPKAPTVEPTAMLLYQINVPAYTLVDDEGVPTTATLKSFEHKRYTMNDLAKVEDRVTHLEYYTALSQLERAARDQSILDIDNQERFKNGIVVDSFLGTDVGDVKQSDFAASIDTRKQELHPAFRSFAMMFTADAGNTTTSGVRVVGDMAIPTYTTDDFVVQPLATHAISVNPFDIGSFYGKIHLSPSVDTWKSTTSRPAQVIDMGGPSQAWVDALLPSYTVWGEWDTTWAGVTSQQTQHDWWVPEGWTPDAHPFRSQQVTTWEDIETSTVQQRQGTQFNFQSESTTTSLGNMVVDTSVVHSIRARDVVFSADGLRPNSRMYPYFDGVNVHGYIQQANIIELDGLTSNAVPTFYRGQTVYVKKALTGNVSVTNAVSTITGSGTQFDFELLSNQLIRIELGINAFDRYVANVTSNTAATFVTAAPMTLSGATLSTLTPVTVADVVTRTSGSTVTVTLKVVRAVRDVDNDTAAAYVIHAGGLSPAKMVKDTANTTTGATLIVPESARNTTSNTINIASAVVVSGVVRSYTSNQLRLDVDITDTAVTTGAVVYFVSGGGQGQTANIVSYNAATQTATVDTSSLTGIVNGNTIYSVGSIVTDGFTANSTVTVGNAGTVAGAVHLQEGQFATGTRIFRLTDNANNTVSDSTTSAETNYTASGLSVTEQAYSVTSRQVGVHRRGVTDTQTITSITQTANTVDWVDPLAQTILVDATKYPQGVFVDSIDLSFSAKPDDDVPIFVEIRPVVNGYPASNQLVPCVSDSGQASTSLRPDQVTVTTAPTFSASSGYTRFTFAAPVQLQPGTEYAIVIRSDSDAYLVYTAEIGGTVIGTDQRVSKQPYAGSFFKSQNASTWTESPFEDLMFRLNRAVWAANVASPLTSYVVLRGMQPTSNTYLDALSFYSHDVKFANTTSVTYTADVLPANTVTGDLTGTTAVRYTVFPNQTYGLNQRSMVHGLVGNTNIQRIYPSIAVGEPSGTKIDVGTANTVDIIARLVTRSSDVAPFIDIKKMSMVGIQYLINDMGLTANQFVIANPGSGYTPNTQTGTVVTTSACTVVTGTTTAFTTTLVVGEDVVIGGNLAVTVASVESPTQFTATAAVGSTRSANTYAIYDHLALTVGASDVGTNATGYAVVGSSNTVESIVLTSNGSGYITSPSISLSGNAAVLYHGEDAISGGNAETRYFIKPVTLATGFDARDLKVYFDAIRPQGTNFYVYYKVLLNGDDTGRFEDRSWQLMEQVTSDAVISVFSNQYREFEFGTANGRAVETDVDNSDKFKVFSVKVVMSTDNTTVVPTIKNFRVIALDQ